MRTKYYYLSVMALLFFCVMLFRTTAEAEIYIYKDKNGKMMMTDSLPDNVGKMEIIKDKNGTSPRSSGFRDIEMELTDKYRPKNDIEKASLSTVTIKTPIRQGSGFFINENGYIVTNKHLIRLDEAEIKKTEENFGIADQKIEDYSETMAEEEKQLKEMKIALDGYKSNIEQIRDPDAKATALQSYKRQSEQYDFYEARFRKRKNESEEKISKYQQEKGELNKKARMAENARKFVVLLKDKTEIEANLVSVSNDHDLALLKIDRCRSPFLQSGVSNQLIQGMRVFAIGSPLGDVDSISSGVLSGYDHEFIRTDARIFPGNSGGPLITADGKVIGINTMKRIAGRYEGLGFAIPITKALQEFSNYIK
ncbi:MAG: S1C family serine protease [Desulfobacterales bacterium]